MWININQGINNNKSFAITVVSEKNTYDGRKFCILVVGEKNTNDGMKFCNYCRWRKNTNDGMKFCILVVGKKTPTTSRPVLEVIHENELSTLQYHELLHPLHSNRYVQNFQ